MSSRHSRALNKGSHLHRVPDLGVSQLSAYHGYRVLKFAFVLTPVVVGLDKFFNVITNWEQYLSPAARYVLGSHVHLFMHCAGAFEILAGIGMLFRPQIFSYVISAWLLSIVINLLLTGTYFDIALRDFILVLCTFALGRFSDSFAPSRHHATHRATHRSR